MTTQPNSTMPDSVQPALTPTHSTGVAGKHRVLVVEDDPSLLSLYTGLLKSDGYDVSQADDGAAAFDAMHEGGFDLVLLDVMLPEMDGLQVLDKLRKEQPKNPNKAVVLLTNLNQDQVVAKALEFNIRGYIVKSDYTPDKFLLEVKQILNSLAQ